MALLAIAVGLASPWANTPTASAQGVPSVSISGVVLTPSGQGADAVRLDVTVLALPGVIGTSKLQPMLTTGRTATDGSFTIAFPLQAALDAVTGNMLNVEITALAVAPAGIQVGNRIVAYQATSGALTPFSPGSIFIQMQQSTIPATSSAGPNTPCVGITCYISCDAGCLPNCYGPYQSSVTTEKDWTVIAELHSWTGMTASFGYKSSSESTVEAASEASGQNTWQSAGFAGVANGTTDNNVQSESDQWGYELLVPVTYQRTGEYYSCEGQNQKVNDSVFPQQSWDTFTIGQNTSYNDGPDQFHAHYADPPQMWNMLPGDVYTKDKSKTETYGAAVTYFGVFTAKSQSVWSTQLEDSWVTSKTLPMPYASAQDPYHLWGNDGQDLNSAQNIYAWSGGDEATGQGAFLGNLNYTNSIFSTSCAGSNTWNFSGSNEPTTLFGEIHTTIFNGPVTISATGHTNCTNLNNETGSFTLLSLSGNDGTHTVSCTYPYGSSGTYTRAGDDLTASGSISCTVNGVPTPNEVIQFSGHWKQNLDDTTGTLQGSISFS